MEKHNFEQELKKERRLVESLIREIDYKNRKLFEMEHKYNETTKTLRGVIDGLIAEINSKNSSLRDQELIYNKTVRQLKGEKTELHYKYVEEIRKVNSENIKLKRELSRQTKELEECRSQNDLERRCLLNEMKLLKENLACQNLIEVDKTSKALVTALRTEEKPKSLQDLENSYNCLMVKQILTNQQLLEAQVAALRKELEEKSEALQDLDRDYNYLAVQHTSINQELQDARKESDLKDILNSRTTLQVKRMGEIDQKAFEVACSLKFPKEDRQEMCAKCVLNYVHHGNSMCRIQNGAHLRRFLWKENCSFWLMQEIVDEDDEKLKELRSEYGEVAFEAVSTALMEMNEHNASGRYAVPEVWNIKEGRRASMKEVIQYIMKQLKSHKRKRKRV